MKELRILAVSFLLFSPLFVFAADNSFSEALTAISKLVKTLTTIAFSLAFLAFFWGMLKYLGTSSEEAKKDAIKLMATSITVVFVMVSIWGLVALLSNTFGVPTQSGDTNLRFPKVTPTAF